MKFILLCYHVIDVLNKGIYFSQYANEDIYYE